MKTRLTLKPLLFGLLGGVFFASLLAHADSPSISLSQLELKNVSQKQDRAVSVFYAVGTPAKVATKGAKPFIRIIKAAPVRAEIRSDGSATIPATTVPASGFQTFNYVVFVVHPANQSDVHICNIDGSSPTTEEAKSDLCDADYLSSTATIYQPVQLNSSRTEVVQVGAAQVSSGSPVTLDLGAAR